MRVFCVLVSLIINARVAKRISLFYFFLLLLLLLSSVCLTEFFFVHLLRSKKRLLFLSRRFSSHHKRGTFRTLLCPKTQQKKDHTHQKRWKKDVSFSSLFWVASEISRHVGERYISLTHIFLYLFVAHTFTHTHARARYLLTTLIKMPSLPSPETTMTLAGVGMVRFIPTLLSFSFSFSE